MKDYRRYQNLYKYIGFFTIIAATFTVSYKFGAWFIWAHQVVASAI